MFLKHFEMRLGPYLVHASDRMRAAFWRQRGSDLGSKCRIGARCVIERPWGLVAGSHCVFEHEVFLKLVNNGARVRLGNRVFIGRGVELDIAEELSVGDNTLLAPGCFITDHSHRHAAWATIDSQGCESGAVRIGADVWLGANVVVLPGVSIGDGAVVGASAVVTKNVSPMVIVAGVPARQIGERR